MTADWVLRGLMLLGLGVAIGGGFVAVAAFLRVSWVLLTHVSGDLIAWKDLREAVDEWKARHPEKAERYRDGSGPWRSW